MRRRTLHRWLGEGYFLLGFWLFGSTFREETGAEEGRSILVLAVDSEEAEEYVDGLLARLGQ